MSKRRGRDFWESKNKETVPNCINGVTMGEFYVDREKAIAGGLQCFVDMHCLNIIADTLRAPKWEFKPENVDRIVNLDAWCSATIDHILRFGVLLDLAKLLDLFSIARPNYKMSEETIEIFKNKAERLIIESENVNSPLDMCRRLYDITKKLGLRLDFSDDVKGLLDAKAQEEVAILVRKSKRISEIKPMVNEIIELANWFSTKLDLRSLTKTLDEKLSVATRSHKDERTIFSTSGKNSLNAPYVAMMEFVTGR